MINYYPSIVLSFVIMDLAIFWNDVSIFEAFLALVSINPILYDFAILN